MPGPRKLGLKEDWAVIPFLLTVSSGFVVSAYDFMVIQERVFQFNGVTVTGIILLIFGGAMRSLPRRALMKAGLKLLSTPWLQTVEGHKLVTDGFYRHIRHPIYLGEIIRNMSVALILSRLYGFIIMVISIVFLLIRIEIEEEMLVEAFGQEYEEYRKKTRRLIPYIY